MKFTILNKQRLRAFLDKEEVKFLVVPRPEPVKLVVDVKDESELFELGQRFNTFRNTPMEWGLLEKEGEKYGEILVPNM